jgi:hypothetical protein
MVSNRYIRPPLRAARPEELPDKIQEDPDSQHHPQSCVTFSLSLSHSHCQFLTRGGDNSWSGRCSPTSGSSYPNAASFSVSEGVCPL